MTDLTPTLTEPIPAVTRPVPHVPPGTRAWFVFFVIWMAGLAALALWLLSQYDHHEDPLALRAWILVLMCFYLSLCNGFIPLPTAWIILLAATPDYALLSRPELNVIAVALIGGLCTAISNLNEYHLLSYGFGNRLGSRLRQTRLYNWAVRWFDRAPFRVLMLVAFIPVPIDAVRWLAILHGYSRPRFGLAYFLGRSGRYLIFAVCAGFHHFTGWQILLIQAGLVVVTLMVQLIWRLAPRRPPLPGA